jgi:predicted 2-oxoglutarate/Fe(II)-dependent dioxygenase YbiX
MNELKDYILVLEDIIPHNLCDEIIREYSDNNEWTDSQTIAKLDKTVRNCQHISISLNDIINKNYDVRKNLDNKIFESTSNAIKKYYDKFNNSSINNDCGYLLLKYEKGNFYKEHTDSWTTLPRTISCSFILNNDFIGGEFSFFKKKYTYSLKKGSAIMFPSNFLYPHEILPVIEGTRYSIVTWFN